MIKSLRIRFALGFAFLFAVLLGTALTIIYFSYAEFRQDEFNNRLKDRALTTFKFLVEVEQIDMEMLQLIDRNTMNSLYDEKVLIFKNKQLIYESLNKHQIDYNDSIFSEAARQKVFFTTQNDYELAAITIEQGADTYTVLASAFDKFGRRKMNFLRLVIIFVYTAGLAISGFVTYLFVMRVIKPLDNLNRNIEKISSENLHVRLNEHGQGDEVDKIASNFNQMLKRLQQSFSFQKDFVHYASHELRTPLTAMIGLTQTALSKQLTSVEYREYMEKLFRQQQELSNITNSLLLLSDHKVDYNNYPPVRLDELVFRSAEIMRNIFPECSIRVDLEADVFNEETMLVKAHEPLLLMAFNNLLKNAIQYATDRAVTVTISLADSTKKVAFRNRGNFFPEEESRQLFTPFYRGANAVHTRGHGLGLPLVQQIADLNGATVEYFRDGDDNIFVFSFHRKTNGAAPLVME